MRQIHIQFLLYAMVGACATATQYITLITLVNGFHLHAVVASSIGIIMGSTVSYYLNHRFTFQSAQRHRDVLLQFYTIAGVATVLNATFMHIGIEKLQLHYMTAQIITTILVLFWNFTCNRFWTFRG